MGLQEMVGRGQVRGGAQGGGGRGQKGRDQALAGGQLQVGGGGGDPLPRRHHAHRDGGVAGAGGGHDARDVEAGRLPHGLHGLQPPGAGDLAPVASVAAGPAALTVRPLGLLILLHGA